jgi:hypothetical protein
MLIESPPTSPGRLSTDGQERRFTTETQRTQRRKADGKEVASIIRQLAASLCAFEDLQNLNA